ncbi:hypothetical protein [Comamonas endophytica]|uniref:Uncharacterized protein n=2 Tax=Comamonas endophytica TaxID=2949090 RepID=A0ABY6G9T3_9BURK|nr:hypothetical protein [Acidovorax sp. 5MLIR]UYG51824.1 hypothetical protein M9799_00770 [Acidovorax sp. 5MLIR]
MFYALSWSLSFVLLGLWSLVCWGLHAATVWAVAGAGALAGGTAAMGSVRAPGGWGVLIPPGLTAEFEALLQSFGPWVEWALSAVPALAGGVTVLAWVIWGLGALALLALAVGAHVLIALFRRRSSRADTAHTAPVH